MNDVRADGSRDPNDRLHREDAAYAGESRVDSANRTHKYLSELDDFRVAKGEPDIRNWTVTTAEGVKIGTVKDLVVDCASMKVSHLKVDLSRDALDIHEDRHALVPIRTARLNDDDDVVVLTNSTAEVLAMPVTIDALRGLDGVGLRSGTVAPTDDDQFFGTRRKGREYDPYFVPREPGS